MGKINRAAAPDISQWPVFIGYIRPGSTAGAAFTRLPLNAAYDTHMGFDAVSSLYTVSQTGTYRLEMKVRYHDGAPGGISIGVGAGEVEGDDAAFFWGVTTGGAGGGRNGLLNQRLLYLEAGAQIRLYTYCDSPDQKIVASGELTIDRIR